jgi:hypothetical protein
MKQNSELRDLCASAVSPSRALLVAVKPRWVFRTTMIESLRGSRKLFGVWNTRTGGIGSRQGAKHAKFGGER